MSVKTLVSVILPTYNGKKERLSQSIESVLAQSFTDFELIIINDASTNDIEDTILKYQERDNRIVYIKNKNNLKIQKTLNKGLQVAKGTYIARIDDDDIRYNNDKLQKQVEFMESHFDYGLCGTDIITIDHSGNKIEKIGQRHTDQDIRNTMLQSCQVAHPSVLVRKDIIKQLGGYDPDIKQAEDYDLWCKIGRVSKLYNIQDVYTYYRINTKSVSNRNRHQVNRWAFKIFRKNRNYYPNFWRAFVLRVGELILPYKVSQYMIKIFKR